MDGGTELGSAQVSRNGLRPGRPGLPRLRARAIDFRASEVFVYTHLCILDPRQHRHRNAWTRGSKKCPVSDPTRLWQGEMLELAARHGWSILTLQFCWLVQLLWIYISSTIFVLQECIGSDKYFAHDGNASPQLQYFQLSLLIHLFTASS